jgi:hypothetical protein
VVILVTMMDQGVRDDRPLLLVKCQMHLSRHLQFNLLLRLLLRFKPFVFSPLRFQMLQLALHRLPAHQLQLLLSRLQFYYINFEIFVK